MKIKFQFNKKYFILFLLLFLLEVIIAVYVHDDFIRPFFGDYLVVFLLYYFVKSFLKLNNFKLIVGVLLFAFGVEYLQYINFVSKIGLQKSNLACAVFGNSFSEVDLSIYLIAALSIITFEKFNSW